MCPLWYAVIVEVVFDIFVFAQHFREAETVSQHQLDIRMPTVTHHAVLFYVPKLS